MTGKTSWNVTNDGEYVILRIGKQENRVPVNAALEMSEKLEDNAEEVKEEVYSPIVE